MLNARSQLIWQILIYAVLFTGAANSLAQQKPTELPSAINKTDAGDSNQSQQEHPSPAYKILPYEEDWSFLRDKTKRTDFFDPIKYIPLRRRGNDWYLTIGGELRPYPERFGSDGFGSAPPDDNGYLLNRAMLHFDFHFGKNLRTFIDFKSGLQTGRRGGSRPIDEDRLDLHQAFVDFRYEFGGGSNEQKDSLKKSSALTFRLGRQELSYGIGRLIALREGPNVRQSFDAARMIAEVKNWRVDFFYAKPVKTNKGTFDDGFERDRSLWGVYATRPFKLGLPTKIDIYYIGLDRKLARFEQGAGREIRQTFGVRLASAPNEKQSFDYAVEVIEQTGTFDMLKKGRGQIRARAVGGNIGYTLQKIRLRPRFSFDLGVASGDKNPADASLQHFNSLFPNGSFFGQIQQIGPDNIRALQPNLTLKFTKKVTAILSNYFFWRDSTGDGLYNIPGILIRTGQLSHARYVGTQPDFEMTWQTTPHFSIHLFTAYFFAGQFLRETPPGKNVNIEGAQLSYVNQE